jgi:hypothetical protein
MTTTYYGAQITKVRAGNLSPSTDCSRLIRQYFYYLVPAATLVVADLLMLGKLPKGCRFFGGAIKGGANTTAATASIGSYTYAATPVVITADKYGTYTSMASINNVAFGETVAKSHGVLETADVYVGLLIADFDVAAANTIRGHFDYLL